MIGKLCSVGIFSMGMAMGQTPALPVMAASSASINHPAFDVVSIRQNLSNTGPQSVGPTPDGYHSIDLPLMLPVLTAFVPSGGGMFSPDRIQGLPDWLTKERYDFDARIAAGDRAAWQNPARQAAILPAMLQAALADRCKMAAHREMKQSSVYLLVLG
ncbi:MAG TPA: TIGR03435 family protein, partial [Acidobacteriaceae bacterium]|nr:TIGR03435 family protein [Acidobacteriaceae bacterium]